MSEQQVDVRTNIPFQDEAGSTAKEPRRGLKDGLSVLLGVAPFALVLGAQASQKGLDSLEVPLMTRLNFAGGSEFAVIQIWISPPPFLLIMAVTLLVNSHHILMGATLVPLLSCFPKRKVLPALFLMTDESQALSCNGAHSKKYRSTVHFSMPYYLGVSLSFYLMWVFCTTLGMLVGPVLDDVHQCSSGMAFPAVFLVLVRGVWDGWREAVPWITSLLVSVVMCHLASGLWYVIADPLAGLMTAALMGSDDA